MRIHVDWKLLEGNKFSFPPNNFWANTQKCTMIISCRYKRNIIGIEIWNEISSGWEENHFLNVTIWSCKCYHLIFVQIVYGSRFEMFLKNWVKEYIIMFSIKCFISCDLQIDKDFSMYLSKPFVNAKGYFKNMTIGYFWDNLMWMVHNNIIIKIDRSNHFSFLRTHIMRNIEAKWCFMHGCWNKITFFDKDILEMNSWWSIMINCSHHSYRFINGGYLFFSDV